MSKEFKNILHSKIHTRSVHVKSIDYNKIVSCVTYTRKYHNNRQNLILNFNSCTYIYLYNNLGSHHGDSKYMGDGKMQRRYYAMSN